MTETHPLSIQCEGGRLHGACPGSSVWWEDKYPPGYQGRRLYARRGADGVRSQRCECGCHEPKALP